MYFINILCDSFFIESVFWLVEEVVNHTNPGMAWDD